MTVDELIKAVAALSPEELEYFRDRFEDHLSGMWEKRLLEMSAPPAPAAEPASQTP